MKKIFYIIIFALISSICFVCAACNGESTNQLDFEVPSTVSVNYGELYDIPVIVAKDGADKEFITRVEVKDHSGKVIDLKNNSFLISDINGYEIRYYIGNISKVMTLSVEDKLVPSIFIKGANYAVVYNRVEKFFRVPLDSVETQDNFSKVKLDYSVQKDGAKVSVVNDVFNVEETGIYEIIFVAKDAMGNVSEKIFKVYSTDKKVDTYIDFEQESDMQLILNYFSSPGSRLEPTRVKYSDLKIPKLENGGNYVLQMKPIMDSIYPHFFIDLGRYMPAGTKIVYKAYFETLESPDAIFSMWAGNFETNTECSLKAAYAENAWFEVVITLTEDTRYLSQYFHLAHWDGYDSPKYLYSAGIKIYVDNFEIKHFEYIMDNYIDNLNLKNYTGDKFFDLTKLNTKLLDSYTGVIYDTVDISVYKSKVSEDNIVNIVEQNGSKGFNFESGVYYICLSDRAGRAQTEIKTFDVFDRDDNILADFEYVSDNNRIVSTEQILNTERVSYESEGIAKLDGGGEYCLKATGITNNWPGPRIDLGKEYKAGTKIRISYYVDYVGGTDKIIVRDNEGDYVQSGVKSGEWHTIEIALKKDSEYFLFSFALDFTESKYNNVNAIYYDNIQIVE